MVIIDQIGVSPVELGTQLLFPSKRPNSTIPAPSGLLVNNSYMNLKPPAPYQTIAFNNPRALSVSACLPKNRTPKHPPSSPPYFPKSPLYIMLNTNPIRPNSPLQPITTNPHLPAISK
jgi:hypothetical protein